ncbi:MAG: C40 family peptidase [Chloroflexota bacterium]
MDDMRIDRRSILLVAAGFAAASGAGTPGAGARKGSGREIARRAAKYEGLPYVWAGNSPRTGFDCSGLTQFVVRKVTGTDITHSVELQWNYGRNVKYGTWQPGDLIFFENTYQPGLSHVGIYLRRNLFIHAENENTGVVVTDLAAEYYASRYAGARRV